MAEDTKKESSPQEIPSQDEKKPLVPAGAVAPKPTPVAPPRAPMAVTPKPAPQPQVAAKPGEPASASRRNFVKALLTVGAVLSLIPFVPWGSFLSSSIVGTGGYKRQKVIVDNVSLNGAAAGQAVNVKDLSTYPPDHSWLITYPSSGDLTADSKNPDNFVKYQLIRLPASLGGGATNAAAFVAFSKVCVHLGCSPSYYPGAGGDVYVCPCHGSTYRVPDGLAIQGPASLQTYPQNAIPMLTLTADANGDLHIEIPVWDVQHNGQLLYGREYQSYDKVIKPAALGSS